MQLPLQELNNGASSAASVTSQRKRLYTWVEQVHSVKHCPPCWRHPLQLVLSVDEVTVPHPTGTSCVTDLPLSLPLNCGDTHLHNWKAQVSITHLQNFQTFEHFENDFNIFSQCR